MRYLVLVFPLYACTAAEYRADADRQVYGILETAAEHVTGQTKVFSIDRPEHTLRRELEDDPEMAVVLDLPTALDVAAQNSREFQTRKERLYAAALALTLRQNDFALRFGGGTSQGVSGVSDDSATVDIRNDLFASRNTTSGGRIVASFVNTFLKDVVRGGTFNPSSILDLTITQPLLRGFGERIAREPLTQAERDVIYEMRTFERFRATFAVSVVSDYYRVLQQIDNLQSEESNQDGTRRNRERVEALVEAGRLAGVDLDRASQQEFDAGDRLNNARVSLESRLDAFRITLGLPTDAQVNVDIAELARLRQVVIRETDLDEDHAIEMALYRRLDHRNVVDDVEDAARGVRVSEDALRSMLNLDFAFSLPTQPDQPLKFDWTQVTWSAGFDLDLALDRLPERNAYRTALIGLDVAIRGRELSQDLVKQDVRQALRSLRRTFTSYQIQSQSLELSERRLERADDFLQAGRGNTLALLDAQEDLLSARLSVTRAIVDWAIARLELLRDLEGLVLEPKGLRYDPGLPLPRGPLSGTGSDGEAE